MWVVVGVLLAAGLSLAILNLYFQKGLTILGTAISGGALMAATLDYFIEKVLMTITTTITQSEQITKLLLMPGYSINVICFERVLYSLVFFRGGGGD